MTYREAKSFEEEAAAEQRRFGSEGRSFKTQRQQGLLTEESGKLHLSRKIQYVEFYSTSFLGLQNWLILGRIAESRIRRKVQGWDMTSNYKTSNYKTSIRRNVFDVK